MHRVFQVPRLTEHNATHAIAYGPHTFKHSIRPSPGVDHGLMVYLRFTMVSIFIGLETWQAGLMQPTAFRAIASRGLHADTAKPDVAVSQLNTDPLVPGCGLNNLR